VPPGTTSHQTNECIVIADLLALTPIYRRIIAGISRKRRQSRAVN
jgi:acetylornithine deacetylase/succinyl-diaminopimelate desuccinylase-like protein